MDGPDLGRPLLFSVLSGLALASALHALSLGRRLRLEAANADTAADVGSFLSTRPLVHVVVVPACVFVVYCLLQLFGSMAERRVLRTGLAGAGILLLLRLTGRRDTVKTISRRNGIAELKNDYAGLRTRTDSILLRPVDFGVGALTMLGLLGTIVGLTLALQDLPSVMSENATDSDRARVLQSLGLAFVTTIVGILGSLTLSLARLVISNVSDKCDAIASGRE